jgi:putative ABC transport system permease protein
MGGIFGIMLGVGISYTVSAFGAWDTIITMPSVLLAFIFSVFVGLLFGLYPARKASMMKPIEALRYE